MWDGKKEIRLVCSMIKVLYSVTFCVLMDSLFQVTRNMSGPAVTLNVQQAVTLNGQVNIKLIAVDLVPVFCFGTNRWPPQPTRQLSSLPWQFSPNLVM
jgi:hypothetical protein